MEQLFTVILISLSAGRGETLLLLTNTLLLSSPPLYFSKTGAHRYLHTWYS